MDRHTHRERGVSASRCSGGVEPESQSVQESLKFWSLWHYKHLSKSAKDNVGLASWWGSHPDWCLCWLHGSKGNGGGTTDWLNNLGWEVGGLWWYKVCTLLRQWFNNSITKNNWRLVPVDLYISKNQILLCLTASHFWSHPRLMLELPPGVWLTLTEVLSPLKFCDILFN